jgi:Secretion system C-terminal sorting domain
MTLSRITSLLFFPILFIGTVSGQAPNLVLTLRYNLTFARYEVFALPDATQSVFNWGPSQISIVVPNSVPDEAFPIVSASGGAWQDNSRIYAPAVAPGFDFHGVGSLGAVTQLISGVEKLIFHFTLPGGGCTTGLRLFINGVDPDSSAPGFFGGDFTNTVFAIVSTIPDGYEAYVSNYNNGGTVCSSAAPLELIAFNVEEVEQQSVRLTWETLNEINFSHFEVERSINSIDFSFIAKIDGKNSVLNNNYEYIDRTVKSGIKYYYRLRIVDNDDSYEYSALEYVKIDNSIFSIQSVSPNPTRDKIGIYFNALSEETLSMTITDVFGSVLEVQDWPVGKGENSKLVDMERYPAGVYMLILVCKNEQFTTQVIRVD